MGKLALVIPAIFSLAAFVLLLIALLAGHKPGVMEDFEIVRFNTSQLGKNLIPVNTATPTLPSWCTKGFIGKLCSPIATAAVGIASDVEEGLSKIENEVADKLADELGIHEFYTVHGLTICEGDFTPNTTTPGAKQNVTKCTKPLKEFNISKILDHELSIGPFDISLNDILSVAGVEDNVQGAINDIHDVTRAFSAVLIVCVALTGLCFVASVLSVLAHERRALILFNIVLSLLAMVVILVSAILVTIGVHKAVKEVNDHGGKVGMAAAVGTKFKAFLWTATALIIIVFLFWVVRFFTVKRRNKGGVGRRWRKG